MKIITSEIIAFIVMLCLVLIAAALIMSGTSLTFMSIFMPNHRLIVPVATIILFYCARVSAYRLIYELQPCAKFFSFVVLIWGLVVWLVAYQN